MSDPSSSSSSSAISANLQWQDPAIRNDLYRIIAQFCEEEGLHATRQAFAEEWTGKVRERDEISGDARKLRKAILDGDWEDVEKLLAKPFVRGNNAFKYAVFKQQMLEHIEQREYQKAFTFLNKRLRELEHFQPFNGEFRDLCYLLSGKSISDAPSFRAWEGVRPARIALVAQFSSILEQERGVEPNESANYIAPHRLKTLLHQAVAFQVKQNSFQKQTAPTISSLLYDYESFVCPNTIKSTMIGHQKNVKSIAWIGQQGHHIASGSSDGTVRIWRTADAQQEVVLPHGSKVWNVAATESGRFLASAGGQALVKLWNLQTNECVANFGSPTLSDVYSCAFDGSESRLLSGGYDKIVRLYDLTSNTLEKTFTGHALGVSCVTFDRTGRLAITASKDCSIRIWDLSSGLCVRTIYGHLGECT